MQWITASGLFAIPMLILTLTIPVLTIRAALRIRRGDPADPRRDGSLAAILFWGFAAAVMGFLGQCSGLYNALVAISAASEIDPRIVTRGFAESFTTTIWGGALLLISGLAWLALRGWGNPARSWESR